MNMLSEKIRAAKFAGILFLLIPLVTAEAQPGINVDEDRIDGIFNEWDKSGSPGCAVGIYHDGEMVFSKGYGEAVLDQNTPITSQTVFYAGSVSKQFTAAAVALLSLRGELELDRPVRNYIPEMPEFEGHQEPTVLQLIHHTSGIPDLYSLLALYEIDLEEVVPFEKMVEVITGQSHLNFEPGSEYLYSNSGYTLLAELVERVSGQTLREFTTDHLFHPLGMNNTHFHDDRHHQINNQALSYQPNENGGFEKSYLANFEGVGPGGLYTTVEDMLKWNQQLMENQLSNASGFNEVMQRRGIIHNGDTLDYAFALQLDEYKGQKRVGHGGTFMGFKAHFLQLPEQQYGSTILCNVGSVDPADLNNELADLFWRDQFEEWLSQYKGTYYSKGLDLEYTLKVKDANLFLDREASPSGKLSFVDNKTFRTSGWEIEFNKSGQDSIEGFSISSGRANNIFFKKKSTH
jgi:CubicO group peptidase (beta-lactamase class C family)